MILAAGMGTRLGKLTTEKPKALVEVNGKPMLVHALEYLKSSGIKEIVINIHHFGEQIIDFLNQKNNFGIHITVSDERNELLDTGGGLMKASWFFDDGNPFLVYNVDILTKTDITKLLQHHKKNKALATLVVKKRETSRFFLVDDKNLLCGWVNKRTDEKIITRKSKSFAEVAFSGIQIIDPAIFQLCKKNGRFSLPQMYLELASHFKIVVYYDEALWYDLGKPENIAKAENKFFII
ncbi:MAG: nucleotidyltransferase family protein [Bacteroidales bacterium]|nr:nucleotidyltransferase family protein [Bacteroidales bacterium]